MYTAIIDTKHGELLFSKTYFDYTKQEVLNMAKRFFNEKITRDEVKEFGITLSIYKNGGGGAFPFGCSGKKVYYGVPRKTRRTNDEN